VGWKPPTNADVYGFTSRSILWRESLNRLREEVFRYHLVCLAETVFQACSIDHCDISPFRINDLRAVRNSVAQNLPSIPPVPPCNLDSTTYGLSVERSSRELCKTLQCRRITYGDFAWNMCSSSSRSKREHIGAEPGIVGKQSQHVPSPRRAGHQANHPRSIEARDSVCAHVHSARLADWLSIEQN
jgi:hypothetical protein